MRGILFIFFLLMAGVGSVLAQQPNDCTGQPGGTGTHTVSNASSPFDPTSLNSLIDQVDMTTTGCGDYVFTLESTEDTLFLSSAIDISPQEDIPFTFVVERAGQRVVLRRSSGASATVIQVTAPNVTLSNQTYMGNGTLSSPLLDIQAGSDNAVVRRVHFEMTAAAGVGVNVAANMVLLERSYFRSQLGTYGDGVLPVGVQLANSASQVEIRASLFNSAGAVFNSHDFHLAANTFVGNMGSGATLITVNAGNATPNFLIQHNHIAPNSATTPIEVTGADANDVIRYNAHITDAVATGTATDSGNVPLPRGLSDYALGDYPLDQMRTDLSLPESGTTFGDVPLVYKGFSSIPPILNNSNLTSDWLFGSPNNFTDFENVGVAADVQWQVGCFATFGNTVWRPSPVDTLAFGVNKIRIGRTVQVLDTAFYAGVRRPSPYLKHYLMSQDSVILTRGNDLSLSDSDGVFTDSIGFDQSGVSGTNSDTSLQVARQLRLNDQPIYVKMVQHVNDRYAHNLETARSPYAIARVEGVPQYPVTDFTITNTSNQTNLDNGNVNLQYSAGPEDIDSLRVQVVLLREPDDTNSTLSDEIVVAGPLSPFSGLPQGSVEFRITPLGWVDGTRYEGDSVVTIGPVQLRQNTGASLWVHLDTLQCIPGNPAIDGTKANPYCDINTALSRATAGVNIVVIYNNAFEPIILDFGSLPQNLNLVSQAFVNGDHTAPRPRIRGLTLNQTGTKVRGFIIEKTSDAPAATISAGGVVLEGNLFRSTDGTDEEHYNGAMIDINGTVLADTVEISNNVIYGGLFGVNFASPAAVQILNNAFVKPPSQNSFGIARDVGYSGTDIPSVVIANNFFTGIGSAYTSPFDAPFVNQFSSGITMERNAFVGSSPGITPTRTTPTLEDSLVRSVRSFGNIMDPGIISNLHQDFTALFTCGVADEGCSPLFAGSSPNYVVSRDFRGAPRSGIPEVGAFESQVNGVSHGTLNINTVGRADLVRYRFTTLNYEPSATPNAFIWWDAFSPGSEDPVYTSDSNSLEIDLLTADKGPLGDITVNGDITPLGPSGGQLYRVCYGFGDAGPSGSELCKNFTTPIVDVDTCMLINSQRCPVGVDSFSVQHPDFEDGLVRLAMHFNSSSSGTVTVSGGVPEQQALTGLTIDTTLPFFNVVANYTAAAGEEESENYYTMNINLKRVVDFSNLELVRESKGGEVYLVPSWRTQSNDPNILQIEGKESGVYYFVQVPSTGGSVTPMAPSGAYTAGTNSVDLQLSGSQFITSNPLIMVNVIPAGSMAGQSVFSTNYFAQNLMLASGLDSLGPDLAGRWAFNYFQRLQSRYAQAVTSQNFGQPPFDFSIDNGTFNSRVSVRPLPEAVSNGSLPSGSVAVNVNQSGGYVRLNSNRKITRGLEFVTTVFDAGRVTLNRSIMPTRFDGDTFFGQDANTVLNDVIPLNTVTWHLFSYPWSESEDGESLLYHLVGDENSFSDKHHRIWKRQGASGFMEWEGGSASGFTFDEGDAIWVAAVNQNAEGAGTFKPVSSGGQSNDNAPFTIDIAEDTWTEFGLPFNFPVRWADIANASSLPADFTIYAYNTGWKDREGNVREGEEAWVAVEADTILQPWSGYVARASTETTVTIPVVDDQRGSAALTKLSASQSGYSVRLIAENSSGRQSLVLGKQTTAQQRWAPPGVPGQNFNVGLRYADAGLARDLRPLDGSVEGQWALTAKTRGDEGLLLRLGEMQGLPDTAGVYLVEELTGSVTQFSPGEEQSLSSEALRSGAYSIVVGSESYVSKWAPQVMAVLRNAPNPFTGVTRFSTNLPLAYGEGDTRIRLKVYNLRGETVYHQTTPMNGKNRRWQITWNGRDQKGSSLPTGAYIAELEVSSRGLPPLTSRRKVVKVR